MDKWLWSVRLYKTRALAIHACDLGRVEASGQRVKPARSVRIGEIITAVTGEITRTVRVTGLTDRRIGAKLVSNYLEDLTPASEYEKARERQFAPPPFKPIPKRRRFFD